MQFTLKKGMTDDEVRDILHDRISGETQDEVGTLMSNEKRIEYPLAEMEIIQANEEYAILCKRRIGTDWLGQVYVLPVYYLVGINDEGKYFAHGFRHFDDRINTIEGIVRWMNRADQGYTKRLQGDILMRLMNYQNNRGELTGGTIGNPYGEGRPQRTWPAIKDDYSAQFGYRLPSGTGGTLWDHPHFVSKSTRNVESISLGNHSLSVVNGMMFIGSDAVIVDADRLIMQHPEHGMTEYDIPEKHYLVLAGQRGRDDQITSSITEQRFD